MNKSKRQHLNEMEGNQTDRQICRVVNPSINKEFYRLKLIYCIYVFFE